MKKKIYVLASIIVLIFLTNILNTFFVPFIYSKQLSTSLDSRQNWYGMCNDIIDFKIKDLKIIFTGDSHIYAGLNLQKFNKEVPKLSLTCSMPTISLKNNLILTERLIEKYDPDIIFVAISQFQFMLADKQKEAERESQFQKVIKKDPFSFQFHSLKKLIIHIFNPYSETEISERQLKFLESKNETFFDKFKNSNKYQKENYIKEYNNYKMPKDNKKLLENFCRSQKKNLDKIIFLNIPTPDYLNNNLIHQKEYENYIVQINKCFNVVEYENIKYLTNKKYYLDRLGQFEKKDYLEYDISHMNFAGSYLLTEYLIKVVNENFITHKK
tara:strand:- start:121 stop:1101 length:981 start_codon:yes stop_codon:yes gene_type:complete